ncbi:uncharacterized protein LOC143035141 isoform X2 [Oratosquilla oratoria]|uniref:uncharacterized protein LOC143035141 isoform X2 n=1 Tax=Oratosquilla oratoria TaxID=337810 RepID=UPI003F75B4E3
MDELRGVMDAYMSCVKSSVMTKGKYDRVVFHLEHPTVATDPHLTLWVKKRRFQLCCSPENGQSQILVVPAKQEEGQNGYKKVLEHVQRDYAGIPRSYVQKLCRDCPVCHHRNSRSFRNVVADDIMQKLQTDVKEIVNIPEEKPADFQVTWSFDMELELIEALREKPYLLNGFQQPQLKNTSDLEEIATRVQRRMNGKLVESITKEAVIEKICCLKVEFQRELWRMKEILNQNSNSVYTPKWPLFIYFQGFAGLEQLVNSHCSTSNFETVQVKMEPIEEHGEERWESEPRETTLPPPEPEQVMMAESQVSSPEPAVSTTEYSHTFTPSPEPNGHTLTKNKNLSRKRSRNSGCGENEIHSSLEMINNLQAQYGDRAGLFAAYIASVIRMYPLNKQTEFISKLNDAVSIFQQENPL